MSRCINEKQLDRWMQVYGPTLTVCVATMPETYSYSEADVPQVVERMHKAMLTGSYHHSGWAFERTCAKLGIKHTRKAIEAFICGDSDVVSGSPVSE